MKRVQNVRMLVYSLLTTLVCLGIYHFMFSSRSIVIEERIPIQLASDYDRDVTSNRADEFVKAARKAAPAVVLIRALQRVDDFYRDEYISTSGSGVIVSPEGYLITSHHVIKNADILEAILEDKRKFRARVVGADPSTDLAVLKIEDENLPHLAFGNSSNVNIGEWVLAIGNPLGLKSSVTAGIISAKGRKIDALSESAIESFIQTDAAINPGNSGGPLINTEGELIGIITAIVTKSSRYEGFSFAVPSVITQKVFKDILEFGTVQRAKMGVTVSNLDDESAHRLSKKGISGVKVELANEEGAAKAGGMQREDVITAINGINISSIAEFNEQMAIRRPNDNINVSYYRDGRIFETKVVMRNHLNSTDFVTIRKDKAFRSLGFELRNLDKIESNRLNVEGVLVVSILKNSKVSDAQMEPNYIITKCNNKRIRNCADLLELLNARETSYTFEGFYEDLEGVFPYTIIR